MRTFKHFFLALLPALLLISPAGASEIPATFTFTGSGYGHGVGMSQIGARAMAMNGESATAIVKYYYSGTDVISVPDTQTLRVNIGHELTHLRLRTDSPNAFTRVLISDEQPLIEVPAKSSLTFALHDGLIALTLTQGKRSTVYPGLPSATVRWSGTRYLAGPDAVMSFTANNVTNKYKYGQIQIKIVKAPKIGNRLEVTNSVLLHDEYLWGISEVPSSWPAAALQAQAIASRTYALNKAGNIRPACDCDLYSMNKDQSFVGYSKESEPRFGALWKAAVTATSPDTSTGLIVAMKGKAIPTYFFSSSAGVTESALNAFGTAAPFALSVPDTASLDIKLNPRFVSWKVSASQSLVASAFLLPDVVSLAIVSQNTTGTVAKIEATSSSGKKAVLRGETFRSRAKLPSSWFSLAG